LSEILLLRNKSLISCSALGSW